MANLNVVQDLINAIVTKLFEHETQRHQRCIDNISLRNSSPGTFMHKAKTFKVSWTSGRRTALDENLWPDMDRFLLDYNQIADDSRQFWQMLFSLLEPCDSIQKVRDALPEFIVELFPHLSVLPRLDKEAWTLENKPRPQRQYLKIREKMEFYAVITKNPAMASLMSFYNFEA